MGGGTGGAGLAFGFFETADPSFLGTQGAGLGAGGLPGYALVFVPGRAAGGAPASDTVAFVDALTFQTLATAAALPTPLDCGCTIPVTVDFDAGTVRVAMAGTLVLEAAIPDWVPFDGYFAFTAATSDLTNEHAVDDVTLHVRSDGPACSPGAIGTCATLCGSTGARTCSGDCSWSLCALPVETCNGIDDDCDAATDEDWPCVAGAAAPCATACGSTGTLTCGPTCKWSACEPPPERCSGSDDDCDGMVDEDFSCVLGAVEACVSPTCGPGGDRHCRPGCTFGPCSPPPETCNAADDDCDGITDESVITAPFADAAAGWTLNGSAYLDDAGDRLVLTGAANGLAGSVVLDAPQLADTFTARFDLYIGDGNGADGMTFAWLDATAPGAPALLGAAGGGLGVLGLPGYAITFDLYRNLEFGDPAGEHVSLRDTSDLSSFGSDASIDATLWCACWIPVVVDFDLGFVTVTLDDTLELAADIPAYAPFPAAFAFTAGTGGLNNTHAIRNVTLTFGDPCP